MATEPEPLKPSYTLRQLVLYFLKLGYAGFGGPVALIAVGSILALIFIKKIQEPYIILVAAVIGLILKTLL